MKMIKLDALGGEMYFNVNKIEALKQEDEFTVVALTNGNNGNYCRVRETPEEIIELIKRVEEI